MTRVFYLVVGLSFMLFVFQQVKKNELSEKESFFWIFGSIVIFILSVFPNVVKFLSEILNIEYPPSLLFLISIIFILLLIFRLTRHVSLLKEQNKELAQLVCILQKQVDTLQNSIFNKKDS